MGTTAVNPTRSKEPVTLATIREATGTEAVSEFLEKRVLPETGWGLGKARRRYVRLEPPDDYWALYRVRVGHGEPLPPEDWVPGPEGSGEEEPEKRWAQERELQLVARGIFDPEGWQAYAERLSRQYDGRPCQPLRGRGHPVLFPETQHCFWFYPVDPGLPGLQVAADPRRVRGLIRAHRRQVLERPARVTAVRVELARYLPEISAILKYDIETSPAEAGRTVYAKVQHSRRAEHADRVARLVWDAARRSGGKLRVARPLAFFPELSLSLQEAMPGEAVGGDRTAPEFKPAALAAAEALAVIQESGIPTDDRIELESELERLDDVVEQFAFVHPRGHFLLRDLLVHLRHHIRHTKEEEWLPTHGDLKHDQFLQHEGRFSIIDFDYFGLAETSYDLGKWCAYAIPSMPKSWEQSFAAEEARRLFLGRYRQLRPSATIQRLSIYEAVMLAGRAMVLMWTQSRGWKDAADSLLSIAMERLKNPVPAA